MGSASGPQLGSRSQQLSHSKLQADRQRRGLQRRGPKAGQTRSGRGLWEQVGVLLQGPPEERCVAC
eukprot:1140771-Pelagomonas_calceolata.AAC.18